MTEELTPKEVALKLLLQDVDPTQVADMLFKLGYSVGWTGWKRDADERVKGLLESARLPADNEAIQRVHQVTITRIRSSISDVQREVIKDMLLEIAHSKGDIRNYKDGVYQGPVHWAPRRRR